MFNILTGKEWRVGNSKNNLFGLNIRYSYMGGDRIHPLNILETMQLHDIVKDMEKAFEDKMPNAKILSLAITYRVNKPKYTGIWSLNVINALAFKEFRGYKYNEVLNKIEVEEDLLLIPNVSYKIQF